MDSKPGLFGKLPAHGDFIARGLSAPLRKALDRWVTPNIGQMMLPDGGLRARLTLAGKPVLLVILSSRDKPGRVFPLVAVTAYPDQDQTDIDAWCDAATDILADGINEGQDASAVSQALPASGEGGAPPFDAIWQKGQTPQPLAEVLAALSSG